jgi:DNA-binding MarR family transcriptional regulator
MSGSQPEESIGFLISDVSRLLRRNFDKRAQKIGLSRAQWQVLAWLKRNEGISQSQLADLLEMSPMTLVRLTARLAMSGLAERRPHPTTAGSINLSRRPCPPEPRPALVHGRETR